MSERGSGRAPSGSGSHPTDQTASRSAPAGFDPSRTAAPYSIDEIAGLLDECRGWHDALDDQEGGAAPFLIARENCLNLRAFLREAGTVLAGIVSAGGADSHSRDFQLMLARIIYRHGKGLDISEAVKGARDLLARKGTLSPLRPDASATASATEAQRAETGTGSVHEGAVGNSETPNPLPQNHHDRSGTGSEVKAI